MPEGRPRHDGDPSGGRVLVDDADTHEIVDLSGLSPVEGEQRKPQPSFKTIACRLKSSAVPPLSLMGKRRPSRSLKSTQIGGLHSSRSFFLIIASSG